MRASLILRSVTSSNRSSDAMVMSAISRADSRAGRNGDARVGLRQGRGVVHAVADHDNGAARSLFPADERGLVLRQDLGVEFVHADLFRDGRGSPAVIAGHHDDLADAAGVQRADSVLCLGAQRVEDADETAASSPAMHRYRCEYCAGRESKFFPFVLRDGARPRTSKTKCALPMSYLFASTMLEMPVARRLYSHPSEWYFRRA